MWAFVGTDVAAATLLTGALLALLLERRSCFGSFLAGQRWIAFVALFALCALALQRGQSVDSWALVVTHPVVAILTVVLIVALLDTTHPLVRTLSLGPVVWLGLVSYGVYLWHRPIGNFLARGNDGLGWGFGLETWAVALAATLAIAALCHYAVDATERRSASRAVTQRLNAGGVPGLGRPG